MAPVLGVSRLFFVACLSTLGGCFSIILDGSKVQEPGVPLPFNHPPIIEAQSFSVLAGEEPRFSLNAADIDSTDLTVEIVSGPEHGLLEVDGLELIYTPQYPYNPTDSVRVRVFDGKNYSETVEIDFGLERNPGIFSEPIPDYISLPEIFDATIDLPLSENTTNPPINLASSSLNPTIVGSPIIQDVVTRPGKSYAGYAPGNSLGQTQGRWSFGGPQIRSTMHRSSFAMQSWVYLPSANVLSAHSWQTNVIYGGGGPNSGAPGLGVKLIGGQPKLVLKDHDTELVSDEDFPLDTWVHVAAAHDYSLTKTQMWLNGFPVAESDSETFEHNGTNFQYNLGSAEWNHIWAQPWRGYISNFRFYKDIPEVNAGALAISLDAEEVAWGNTVNYTITGGSGVFQLSAGGGTFSETSSRTGTYNPIDSSCRGCVIPIIVTDLWTGASATRNIFVPELLPLNLTVSSTSVFINEILTYTVTGGSGNYEVSSDASIDNGSGSGTAISHPTPGTMNIYVYDWTTGEMVETEIQVLQP